MMIKNNAVDIFPNILTDEYSSKQKQSFIVHKFINQGSFGMIFLIEEVNTKKVCVAKIINQSLSKISPSNEIECMKLCDHENIIKYYGDYISDKSKHSMIIMEYADCGDLKTVICSKRNNNMRFKLKSYCYFFEDDILFTFCQIAKGLKHIHDNNIIHRDIKPENIYLTSDDKLKIGDFHLSKIYNCNINKIRETERVGTPYYAAPEIWLNKPHNYKIDIWALGVLLYELASLKLPFFSHDLDELEKLIIAGKYDPIPDIFSNDLHNLIDSMLILDFEHRPSIDNILKLDFLQDFL
jgi:NIMA (never in mitosis gene a)-related kinase